MTITFYAMILLTVILAFLLVCYGSQWIDQLYEKRKDILTFPNDIEKRKKYRKWILGILFTGSGLLLCWKSSLPEILFLLFATALLLLMTVTDFEQYCLFDDMMVPFALGGLAWCLVFPETAINHGIAAVVGGGVFFLLAVLSGGALGGGDVKLVAALGLWLGTEQLLSVVCLGMVFGGLVAGILLLLKKKKRKSAFAYGPYFALTTVALFLIHGGV